MARGVIAGRLSGIKDRRFAVDARNSGTRRGRNWPGRDIRCASAHPNRVLARATPILGKNDRTSGASGWWGVQLRRLTVKLAGDTLHRGRSR